MNEAALFRKKKAAASHGCRSDDTETLGGREKHRIGHVIFSFVWVI